MNIEQIASTMMTGEPIHDGIVIGTIFYCFIIFYEAVFGAIFSLFKK